MQDEFHAYVKFIGTENDDGSVAIAKAGRTLLALDRWAKRYQREYTPKQDKLEIKIKDVKKNCSEIELLIKAGEELLKAGTVATLGGVAWKNLGFQEFCKQFMGTLGEQIALKKFLKNDKPKSTSDVYLGKDNKPLIDIITNDDIKHTVSAEAIDIYRKTGDSLNGLNTLEENENDEMRIGYYVNPATALDVAQLVPSDKPYFSDLLTEEVLQGRLSEGFDEEKAKEITLVGRFLDYRGMATKYRFSFQARKNTKEYGRQKILCIVSNETTEAEILDLLKPQNKKDIVLNGLATKDWEGSIDKLKINWINENPNYNPSQIEIFYTDNLDTEGKNDEAKI